MKRREYDWAYKPSVRKELMTQQATTRTTKYRVQRSDHLGIVTRAFGGRCVHWSPWRTMASFDTYEEARLHYTRWSKQGLTRWRLAYGKEIKLTSM